MKILENGLQGRVRATKTACMDQCELGCIVVVYPDDVWYKGVRMEDVEEIFKEHVLEGRPVDRLRMSAQDLEWIWRCRGQGRILYPRPVPYEE
jgi:(2Fe-2S) ferredoxin